MHDSFSLITCIQALISHDGNHSLAFIPGLVDIQQRGQLFMGKKKKREREREETKDGKKRVMGVRIYA